MLCSKSFILSAVEWMSTSRSLSPVLPRQTAKVSRPIRARGFQHLLATSVGVVHGWRNTTARMCAWSPQESTGFPSTIFWSRPATSFLRIRSTLRRFAARKPTRKMPSGSRISSSTTWFLGALFLLRIFASFEIWCATAGSSLILQLAKRIVLKTALPCPTSNWTTCFQTCSAKLLPLSRLACWKTPQRKSRMFPASVPKA